jgi:DNA primase
MISSYQAGVKNIVAIKGSAVTREQVELLKRFCDNFYFCLDADYAGQEAAKRGIEIAEAAGVNIRAIKLPVGKDPDECVRTDPSAWREASKKTIAIYDFYLQSAQEQFGTKTGEAKKRLSEEVLPFFNKIQNEVMKSHYFKKLAEILTTSEEVVIREAQRQERLKKSFRVFAQPAVKPQVKLRRELTEEYLLALILHAQEGADLLIKDLKEAWLISAAIIRIFSYLKRYLGKETHMEIKNFVKILPAELLETVNRLYLYDLQNLEENPELLQKEWQKGWIEVEKMALHDKLGRLRDSFKQVGGEETIATGKEIVAISRKLRKL